jgi:hypothetical protein
LETTVLVVNFNTRQLTKSCLESLFGCTRVILPNVIVVDNASTDGSAEAIREAFPGVRLIACEENLGFAAANNLAARDATGAYILLLNPDTVVQDGAIDRIVEFAEGHPEAGIFGGRTVFGDGRLNPTSCWRQPSLWGLACRAICLDKVFPNSRIFNCDAYGGWQRDSFREIDIVSGCFLLIRRELWERLGGFDPDFYMYAEDWDLCMRARRMGARCLFCPDAQIVHYGGASEPLLSGKMVRLLTTKARLIRKHWSPARAFGAIRLLDLWVIVRLVGYGLLSLLLPAKHKGYTCWREVWRQRSQWHT